MFKYYRLKDYDFKLIVYVIIISIFGILLVNSALPDNMQKQMMGVVVGFVIMVILSFVDYHIWLKFWPAYYVLNVGLLLAVIIWGEKSLGAQRWIRIMGIKFQPSELAKILLILFFAAFIMKFKDVINEWYMILVMLVLAAIPIALIYKQPDLSTTIVMSLIFFSILYIGEINYRYIIGFLAVFVPAAIIIFILLIQPDSVLVGKNGDDGLVHSYQQLRILAWLHPEEYELEEAFQQQNSIMAIGSGQLTGKGLNNTGVNSVKNGNFISEPQTDFIFTVAGEELGFIGTTTIIVILMLISIECMIIAFKAADVAGRVIAGGMGAYIGFQTLINVSVTTGLFPNTGLPLPFVSYGLTSLVALFAGIGFVINVRLQISRKNSTESK
jgi:rod shape determining protein RodA